MQANYFIVMGVSGCGKSTLATALAAEFGWPMIEGDAYHPPANLAKMAAGNPLNDTDRAPWLAQLNTQLASYPQAVLSCSALKAQYRQVLVRGLKGAVFVHLAGSFETVAARLAARSGHFMPPALLQSQFAALEVPNPEIEGVHCITVDLSLSTPAQLAQIRAQLSAL